MHCAGYKICLETEDYRRSVVHSALMAFLMLQVMSELLGITYKVLHNQSPAYFFLLPLLLTMHSSAVSFLAAF